jgi:tight adherence protein B
VDPLTLQILASLCLFLAVYLFVGHSLPAARAFLARQETLYDQVLNQQLLLRIAPRHVLILAALGVIALTVMGFVMGGWMAGVIGVGLGLALPQLVIRHLRAKRLARLDEQLVDGITTLAAGVRAGLNLVQAFELVARNHVAPLAQEIGQMLREYQMGMDLHQAMRHTANRIGSQPYRLLFTALETHRTRGGDIGETLDRIADAIREIQRLESKLDAITAQGRYQAWMMAVMPVGFLFMLYGMDPQGVTMLFTHPIGRILLLVIALLIVTGYLWIKKILAVDI